MIATKHHLDGAALHILLDRPKANGMIGSPARAAAKVARILGPRATQSLQAPCLCSSTCRPLALRFAFPP